jgi:iron complex outermembrane receptor protein
LKDLGVTDVSQLAAVVPGFTFAYAQSGAPLYALRGIAFNASELAAAPAVAVYTDQAPLPYSFMTGNAFLDVDHIEVVKGPQGTLFGENSTAGSINVIPMRPTADFTAGTELSANNFGQLQNDGHVGGALSSTANARVAYSISEFGDWQRPYFKGVYDNGKSNKGYLRLLVDWTPSDRLTVSLNLNGGIDHSQQQQPQPRFPTPANPATANPGLLTYPIPTDPRDADIYPGFSAQLGNKLYQSVLRADYRLNDDMKLISITDLVGAETVIPENLSGTWFPTAASVTTARDNTIAQELRVQGTALSSQLNYIFGGNFEDDFLYENNQQDLIDYSGLLPGSVLNNNYHLQAREGGVFTNADYQIVPDLTLTAGARYTLTREAIQGCSADGGNGLISSLIGTYANIFRGLAGLPPTNAFVPGGCITLNASGPNPDYLPFSIDDAMNEHNISWRGGVNYKFAPDMLLYTIISRGFKAGVFSDTSIIASNASVPVKQEELTSYEGGTKLAFFDRKLSMDGSIFYYDYINKQFSTYVPTIFGGASILKNIPASKAYGVDLDFVARPMTGLTLRAAGTFLHSQIGPFLGYSHNAAAPEQYEGSAFSYAPKLTATFDASYSMPLTDEIAAIYGVSGLSASRTWSDLGEVPGNTIPGYTLMNLRVGLESSRHWRALAWIRNVGNKYYYTSSASGGDEQTVTAGLPRTFGVTLGYEF